MIAVDIPMPKTCCDCPCFDGVEYLCAVKPSLRDGQNWIAKHRHPDCPIMEVEHIRDKTEVSMYDVHQIPKEVLNAYTEDIQAKRLGELIFDRPELVRKNYSDDLDSYVRDFTVDCFVVKIGNKKEDI